MCFTGYRFWTTPAADADWRKIISREASLLPDVPPIQSISVSNNDARSRFDLFQSIRDVPHGVIQLEKMNGVTVVPAKLQNVHFNNWVTQVPLPDPRPEDTQTYRMRLDAVLHSIANARQSQSLSINADA